MVVILGNNYNGIALTEQSVKEYQQKNQIYLEAGAEGLFVCVEGKFYQASTSAYNTIEKWMRG